MPTNTRREKLALLNQCLVTCRQNDISYRTPALADVISKFLKPYAFGLATEREYVRMLVDALAWEDKHQKEFKFAD